MDKNKTKSCNGISLSDVMISEHSKNDVCYSHLFKFILVILSSLASIFSFISALEFNVNIPLFITFTVIISGLICSFKISDYKVKIISGIFIVLIISYYLINLKKVILGLKHLTNEYLSRIDAEQIFTNISSASKNANMTLAFTFIILLITYGLCFTLFYRTTFVGTFCMTFPFLELALFWGLVPNILCFCIVLAVWLISFCAQNSTFTKVKTKKNNTYVLKTQNKTFYSASEEQLFTTSSRTASFIAIVCACVLLLSLIINSVFSDRPDYIDNTRLSIKNAVNNFKVENIQLYIDDIFSNFEIDSLFGTENGIINNGNLNDSGKVSHENKDMLEIELQELFSSNVLYLKGYSGAKYNGSSWKQLDSKIYSKYKKLFDKSDYGFQDYSSFLMNSSYNNESFKQIFINDLTKSKNLYIPYSVDFNSIENAYVVNDTYLRTTESSYLLEFGINISSYDSIPNFQNYSTIYSELYDDYKEFVFENYRDFDEDIIKNAYNDIVKLFVYNYSNVYEFYLDTHIILPNAFESTEIQDLVNNHQDVDYDCTKDGFLDANNKGDIYTLSVVSEIISDYFNDNFDYTLKPGKTPLGEDFVQYFLDEQKKGYCTYFASAGTLLLRGFGFPTRYVEGYIAPKSIFKLDDDGIYRATVKDKYAHAWCEVFVDEIGWVPIEFTPGYNRSDYINNHLQTITTTIRYPDMTTTTTTSAKTTTSKQNETEIVSTDSQNKTTTVTTEKTSNNGKKADYSKILGVVVNALLIVFTFLLLLYLYKHIYTKKRHYYTSLINDKNRNKAVIEIYKQLFVIFEQVNIKPITYKTDIQNSFNIYDCLQKYKPDITKDEYMTFTELCVEADMSKNTISENSYQSAYELFNKITSAIYSSSKPFTKFKLKYLKFLY